MILMLQKLVCIGFTLSPTIIYYGIILPVTILPVHRSPPYRLRER